MDGHQPKSDKPFDPETAVPPPSGTGLQPPREAKPTESERMMSRVHMKPKNAHAVVELTVQVLAQSWGPDCTVGQAATQATESAMQTLRAALTDVNGTPRKRGIKILGARCVRVVCEAEADGR